MPSVKHKNLMCLHKTPSGCSLLMKASCGCQAQNRSWTPREFWEHVCAFIADNVNSEMTNKSSAGGFGIGCRRWWWRWWRHDSRQGESVTFRFYCGWRHRGCGDTQHVHPKEFFKGSEEEILSLAANPSFVATMRQMRLTVTLLCTITKATTTKARMLSSNGHSPRCTGISKCKMITFRALIHTISTHSLI